MTMFMWPEILMYIMPIVSIIFLVRYKPILKELRINLTVGQVLLPLWVVLIDGFSWLTNGVSLLPLWVCITTLMLGMQLYDYVRQVREFTYKSYFPKMWSLVFRSATSMLLGTMLARIISYFI